MDINSENAKAVRAGNLIYELFILIVTIASLIGVAGWLILAEHMIHKEALHKIDILLCAVFFVDFLRSLYLAPDKRAYLRLGWLDLLGSIPAHPLLRLARLPRAVQAVRALRHKKRSQLAREMRENRPRSAFLITCLVAILVISVGSIAVLEFESRRPDANISAGADAVWWAFVTVTTVGYGDHVPVSDAARLLAMLLMLVGIGIFGVLTSYLAHWFVSTDEEEFESDIANLKADTIAMKEDISAVKRSIGAVQTDLAAIKRLLQEQNQSLTESDGQNGGKQP
jgi:voltage-gated potassium channel